MTLYYAHLIHDIYAPILEKFTHTIIHAFIERHLANINLFIKQLSIILQ